jgi:hypothetical protein
MENTVVSTAAGQAPSISLLLPAAPALRSDLELLAIAVIQLRETSLQLANALKAKKGDTALRAR